VKRKILVPMFASVMALSINSVVSADETNNDKKLNNENIANDKVDLGEYTEIKYKKAVVKEGVAVKVRDDGSVKTVIYSGDELKAIATQGEWVRVELDEDEEGNMQYGWVAARYVDLVGVIAYTSHDKVNFRKEANVESEIIKEFELGENVRILEDNGNWLKVKKGEDEGYVRSLYISEEAPVIEEEEEVSVVQTTTNKTTNSNSSNKTTTNKNTTNKNTTNKNTTTNKQPSSENVASANTSLAQAVINLAYSKIGSPYVWGAEGPNSFDCSGFTSYVFRNAAGISLPRTSSAQSGYGTTVSKSNLQPGDLVFFTTNGTGNVSHVGIYVGGGNMVHSPSTGKSVCVTSINSSYYSSRFVTAKRVL
jgi:cell wall-associated NlpC family hydrolase